MRMSRVLLILIAGLALPGCTFQLASNVYPLGAKSQQQQQLDFLTCKDQATTASNSAGNVATQVALGFTIVGLPAAWEIDKSVQRDAFKTCMEARGYRVVPVENEPQPKTAEQIEPKLNYQNTAARLETLGDLRDKGLISNAEYERKRKEILDGM